MIKSKKFQKITVKRMSTHIKEAFELKEIIEFSDIYDRLKDMKADGQFVSKYHKKAFNHLTKSIKRLEQIVINCI